MPIRIGDPPDRERDMGVTRRSALGGVLAAVLTPALFAGKAESIAWGQQPAVPATPLPRFDHTVTVINDGCVLVAGGAYQGILSDAQIYSPASNSWTATGSMNTPRARHAAAAMPGGQILVCGGIYLGTMSDAEMYDPGTGSWTALPPMNIPRFGHCAAPVTGGVLVYGGEYTGSLMSPEFFDGASWTLL